MGSTKRLVQPYERYGSLNYGFTRPVADCLSAATALRARSPLRRTVQLASDEPGCEKGLQIFYLARPNLMSQEVGARLSNGVAAPVIRRRCRAAE
jgi:hypothetical protein